MEWRIKKTDIANLWLLEVNGESVGRIFFYYGDIDSDINESRIFVAMDRFSISIEDYKELNLANYQLTKLQIKEAIIKLEKEVKYVKPGKYVRRIK
jgi:hypothetical protein